MEQQFIFKDKEDNVLQIVRDLGQVAAILKDAELVKPMDGATLEMYLFMHHMKINVGGIDYMHNGCSWGINQPDVFVYKQI